MKRLLLLPALLLGTASFAANAKYEISPMIGYNLAEGNIGLKNDGYYMGGLEIQANSLKSKLSPEFSVYYTHNADYDNSSKDTDILRLAFNGVYTFDAMKSVIPFAKAGAGYETVNNETAANQDGFFLDAGAGLKVPLSESFAFKAEAIYVAKIANTHNSHTDNNLMGLVGFTYSFGALQQKAAPKKVVIPKKKVVEEVVEKEVIIVPVEIDSDKDGVFDKVDKCPNTPLNTKVDANGCPVDNDQDGVLNDNDLCPKTPLGEKVDKNGCPLTINLHITFANNSAVVPANASANLDKYAKFLKINKNYSAKIVGYTDSRGSDNYNQKLSEKRAQAVMNDLIAKGVNPKQLSAVGMGKLNPIATNKTAEGRAKNRRIEAELSYK
jgi:OOP family OmpA-OmpF porin